MVLVLNVRGAHMIMDRNGRVQNSNRGGFQEEDEKAVKDGEQKRTRNH